MSYTIQPGDVIPLATGDVTILEKQEHHGSIRVLAARLNPIHPFAVWRWDDREGALYSGKYFETLETAEFNFWEST